MNNNSENKISEIKNEIERTKDNIGKGINLAIERGENLDVLVVKSEHLQEDARIFNKQAARLKRQMCIRKLKTAFVLFLIFLLIILLLLFAICGLRFDRC